MLVQIHDIIQCGGRKIFGERYLTSVFVCFVIGHLHSAHSVYLDWSDRAKTVFRSVIGTFSECSEVAPWQVHPFVWTSDIVSHFSQWAYSVAALPNQISVLSGERDKNDGYLYKSYIIGRNDTIDKESILYGYRAITSGCPNQTDKLEKC